MNNTPRSLNLLLCIDSLLQSALSKDEGNGRSVLKDVKSIKSLLSEVLGVFLYESNDPETLAGLITHIEFEGELHSMNFPLHGIMMVKGEIMKVTCNYK